MSSVYVGCWDVENITASFDENLIFGPVTLEMWDRHGQSNARVNIYLEKEKAKKLLAAIQDAFPVEPSNVIKIPLHAAE